MKTHTHTKETNKKKTNKKAANKTTKAWQWESFLENKCINENVRITISVITGQGTSLKYI